MGHSSSSWQLSSSPGQQGASLDSTMSFLSFLMSTSVFTYKPCGFVYLSSTTCLFLPTSLLPISLTKCSNLSPTLRAETIKNSSFLQYHNGETNLKVHALKQSSPLKRESLFNKTLISSNHFKGIKKSPKFRIFQLKSTNFQTIK